MRRIANIALNDAMILPYHANPGRMEFSERTGHSMHAQPKETNRGEHHWTGLRGTPVFIENLGSVAGLDARIFLSPSIASA
jgi:hypothetical protein